MTDVPLPPQLEMIKALGAMDNQDSGISFDVKMKKSAKIQNVHVCIPSWVLVIGTIVGGTSALIIANEIVKELSGEGFLPELGLGITEEEKAKMAEGAMKGPLLTLLGV